jgi:hypothetical protein
LPDAHAASRPAKAHAASRPPEARAASRPAKARGPRWLLLIHQLPPKPAYFRVKIGRQLARIGAVAVKNSVYVLPSGEQAREDLAWVHREIASGGGEASVCEASFFEGLTDAEVEALFHAARNADYAEVVEEARAAQKALPRKGALPAGRRAALEADVARLRKRLGEIAAIDFFGAPGRTPAEARVASLAERLSEGAGGARGRAPALSRDDYQGRTWVTRANPHVDRLASAWLIARFIDARPKFKLVAGKDHAPLAGELRFDMFQAEFTHEGDLCTFEVLLERFGLGDRALAAIAEMVHDIDLKDDKFGRPERAGVERLIAGLALTERDDHARIEKARTLFDALHAALERRPDPASAPAVRAPSS